MKKLILINSSAEQSNLANIKQALSSAKDLGFISAVADTSLLRDVISNSSEDDIVIADARLVDSPRALSSAISATRSSDLMFIQPDSNPSDNSLETVTTDNLIQFILHSNSLAFLAVSATKSALLATPTMEKLASNEAIARLAISAIAQANSVMIANGIMNSENQPLPDSSLSNSQRANLLSYAISSANIEELFPNYAWKDHEQESAAACFHTLAAHFIRLNDYKSAEECLSMSDQLEDSPRSLALRAMICKEQGQTLGAVANLVSSLQQYEDRKRNTENKHYFTFVPNDLEKINTNLQSGLSALNKQENEQAFSYFKTAVFNFDNFYQETGLED